MSRTSYLRRPLSALLMAAALASVVMVAVVSTGAKDQAGNSLDQDPALGGSQQKVWFFKVSN